MTVFCCFFHMPAKVQAFKEGIDSKSSIGIGRRLEGQRFAAIRQCDSRDEGCMPVWLWDCVHRTKQQVAEGSRM